MDRLNDMNSLYSLDLDNYPSSDDGSVCSLWKTLPDVTGKFSEPRYPVSGSQHLGESMHMDNMRFQTNIEHLSGLSNKSHSSTRNDDIEHKTFDNYLQIGSSNTGYKDADDDTAKLKQAALETEAMGYKLAKEIQQLRSRSHRWREECASVTTTLRNAETENRNLSLLVKDWESKYRVEAALRQQCEADVKDKAMTIRDLELTIRRNQTEVTARTDTLRGEWETRAAESEFKASQNAIRARDAELRVQEMEGRVESLGKMLAEAEVRRVAERSALLVEIETMRENISQQAKEEQRRRLSPSKSLLMSSSLSSTGPGPVAVQSPSPSPAEEGLVFQLEAETRRRARVEERVRWLETQLTSLQAASTDEVDAQHQRVMDLTSKVSQLTSETDRLTDEIVRLQDEIVRLKIELRSSSEARARAEASETAMRAKMEAMETSMKVKVEAMESSMRTRLEATEAAMRAKVEAAETSMHQLSEEALLVRSQLVRMERKYRESRGHCKQLLQALRSYEVLIPATTRPPSTPHTHPPLPGPVPKPAGQDRVRGGGGDAVVPDVGLHRPATAKGVVHREASGGRCSDRDRQEEAVREALAAAARAEGKYRGERARSQYLWHKLVESVGDDTERALTDVLSEHDVYPFIFLNFLNFNYRFALDNLFSSKQRLASIYVETARPLFEGLDLQSFKFNDQLELSALFEDLVTRSCHEHWQCPANYEYDNVSFLTELRKQNHYYLIRSGNSPRYFGVVLQNICKCSIRKCNHSGNSYNSHILRVMWPPIWEWFLV
eukprot:gene3708-7372_t